MCCFPVSRHCEEQSDAANQRLRVRLLVCFTDARNEGGVWGEATKKAPENRGLSLSH